MCYFTRIAEDKEQKLNNFPFFSPLRHEETRSYMVKEGI